MTDEEKRTIFGWAGRLSVKDEPLTMSEAALLAAISTADRAMETRDIMRDIQNRMIRIELYISKVVPDYDQTVQRELRAIAEAAKLDA